jgi:hypothetical protein
LGADTALNPLLLKFQSLCASLLKTSINLAGQMRRLTNKILLVLFLCGLFSCSSTKNIAGKYATNFASLGFFGTTIILKPDSTLSYKFSGDLIYHLVTGTYKVSNNRIYMLFDKEIMDTNFVNSPLFDDTIHLAISKNDTIRYQRYFYTGHNKLFFSNYKTGERITKAKRYNRRKKFLFFGSHYYTKRHYLRPIM